MNRVLTTAATGLHAQQSNIQRIANDMANVNTDSYKKSRTEFSDLMYQTIKEPGAQLGANTTTPVGVQVGMGVKVNGTYKDFEQGPARMTSHPLDIMIDGRGFFPIQLPNGEIAYTRNGDFQKDAQGRLVLTNGAQILPQITIPSNSGGIKIDNNGVVSALMPDGAEAVIGQIQVIQFQNERGLAAVGEGVYKVTPASGAPQQGVPGENGFGTILQGSREGSNVDIANSMVDMIATQRAYEMGTKVMSTADEMLKATVNIK